MSIDYDEEKPVRKDDKTSKKTENCARLPPSSIVCSAYENPEKWII